MVFSLPRQYILYACLNHQKASHLLVVAIDLQCKILIDSFYYINHMIGCLGCFTSFKEGQKLKHEEGLTIEFKDYSLPIKENKGKRTITQTIVSFLNSQGGNIYVSVKDKGIVNGVELYDRDKQHFKQFIEELLKNIRPQPMLNDESLIRVLFVPVLSKKGFQNKYVPKIIVKQGDPSRIYYFLHQLTIQSENQTENHEVLYSYIRHNCAGREKLRGFALLKEIRDTAITPRLVANETHACNPEPLVPEEAPGIMSITSVSFEEHKEIELFFTENLAELGVALKVGYRAERQTLFLIFQQNSQFQKTKNILKESLDYLNQCNNRHVFKIDSEQKREFTLVKIDKFKMVKEESDKRESKPKQRERQVKKKENASLMKEIQKACPVKEKSSLEKQKREKKKVKNQVGDKIEEGEKVEQIQKPLKKQKNAAQVGFSKKHGITFSHIDTQKTDLLIEYIHLLRPELQINFTKYANSLQVFVSNNEQKQALQHALLQKNKELRQFGFKQHCLIWGKNQKMIVVKNYDKNKRQDLKAYLLALMKGDLINITFQNVSKGIHVTAIELTNPDKACAWLDKLIVNYELKTRFGIPGSKDRQSATIKCILILKNRYVSQLENANDYYV